MSSKETQNIIPRLRITESKLLSLHYRTGKTDPTSYNLGPLKLQGAINYRFSAVKKNSFKIISTQEIRIADTLFRARHETRFVTDIPMTPDLLENEAFRDDAIDMLLPFGSELFANLSGKSFTSPIIAPSGLPENEEAKAKTNDYADHSDSS